MADFRHVKITTGASKMEISGNMVLLHGGKWLNMHRLTVL